MKIEKVVVLGASPKSERYSNKAIKMLIEYGHKVIPINLQHSNIEGLTVVKDLTEIKDSVDTVTVYLNSAQSFPLREKILALNPRRIIFNPGAESNELKEYFENNNIKTVDGCTLVMLKAGTF